MNCFYFMPLVPVVQLWLNQHRGTLGPLHWMSFGHKPTTMNPKGARVKRFYKANWRHCRQLAVASPACENDSRRSVSGLA
ncbi:MAG: hypothetical protein KatS3mg110_4433 [Pirellulaceae bacterium]|nr:MAG: hypothetical protein KatS3mg110_4433 [Pirellulaceae bacterium]